MSNKKTINVVCHYASIYGGNFIPSLIRLAACLSEYNIIFTFPNEARGRNWAHFIIKSGYTVNFIDFSNKALEKELKYINRINNVDIMYTHFLSGLRVKNFYPFSKKIKLLIHVHSDFTGGLKQSFFDKLKEFIEFRLIRKDAEYIYVSEAMWSRHSKFKGQNYVQNALCLERIPAEPDVVPQKNGKTTFLTFGWSPFVKGIDITVKAFLESKLQNVQLIVVHGRDDGYQKCVNYLKNKLGNDSFLNDERISFAPPAENVFNFYSLADVFISSSRSEGFSYSVLEALYFNLRVLCSDIEGTSWVKKYNNVQTFKSEDFRNLQVLIEKCSNYKKNCEKNINILEDFSIINWCNSIAKIIDNI